jgi:hypothetical protein
MLTFYNIKIFGQVRSGKRNKLPFLWTVMLKELNELFGLASMINVLILEEEMGVKKIPLNLNAWLLLKTQINLNYV